MDAYLSLQVFAACFPGDRDPDHKLAVLFNLYIKCGPSGWRFLQPQALDTVQAPSLHLESVIPMFSLTCVSFYLRVLLGGVSDMSIPLFSLR